MNTWTVCKHCQTNNVPYKMIQDGIFAPVVITSNNDKSCQVDLTLTLLRQKNVRIEFFTSILSKLRLKQTPKFKRSAQ